MAWELNDTYQIFVAEAARFGQPFQKLGKIIAEAVTSTEPLPGSDPAATELSSLGQDARNITDYDWDVKGLDFSNFQGSVVLSGTEEFAAIVILVRPEQFATLPVSKQLAAAPDLNRVQ